MSAYNLGDDTLYIFNEQYNGDYKTDYASELKPVSIPDDVRVDSINYNINGGTINGEYATEYKFGETTVLPTDVTRSGYNFEGWYEDSEFAGEQVTEIPATETGDKEYFAKWTKKSSGGGSSSTTTTTIKNDDGSTTKTTTNKSTGTITEVTTNADGSTTTVETKKDGTVTTTEKDAEGNTVTTVKKADGTTTTTEKTADGTKVTTETTADGETTAEINLSKDKETEIVIPAKNSDDVTSVVVTDANGNETEITDFEITEDGIKISVSEDCTVAVGFAEKKIFDDVHPVNHWATADVDYTCIKGLMKGTSENLFSPDMPLTRAMLVTVLWRLEGEPDVVGDDAHIVPPFADVDMGAYYAKAVIWAKQNGLVNGISDTEFAPDQNITREQVATIMNRYAQYKGYDVSVGENTNILSYDDFDSISEYAISSIQYAAGSGLMKGKSSTTLNPLDNTTRAEIAAILHRFIEANK